MECELIGFCDASASAFCAALYGRWSKGGTTYCTLLCSKTRVAPIKQLTIPKLELEAALLLAKLMNRLQTLFKKNFKKVTCFCDAQVVLSWLNRPPEKWAPFVSNRVRKITEYIPAYNWFFVGTRENPADLATRGLTVESFMGAAGRFWLSGPAFLHNSEEFENKGVPFELVRSSFQIQTLPTPFIEKSLKDIIESFSSYERLISTFARILLRFSKTRSLLLLDARNQVLKSIIKILQAAYFDMDSAISKKSKLAPLLPFLDSDGLIQVGGRLENSSFSEDMRHPVILPGVSKLKNSIMLGARS